MIRFVLKLILPLAVLLVAAIVGYNYFYGSPEEKESSRQIIAKVKGLGDDVLNLLSSEKDKLEAGKYDQAIDRIAASLDFLKTKAAEFAGTSQQFLDQIQRLEDEKKELENQLSRWSNNHPGNAASGDGEVTMNSRSQDGPSAKLIQGRIEELARQTEALAMQMEDN